MSALSGKRVVVTRAPHQADELAHLLQDHGAVPLLYPCIDIAPPDDPAPLDAALSAAAAGAFDWLALTSTNTVQALARRLDALRLSAAIFSGVRVAAVGPATADAAGNVLGLRAQVVPDAFSARALARALPSLSDKRVLLPQSALAETDLSVALSELGAAVTVVVAYQTGIGTGGVDLPALLAAEDVDAITLTSSSTVANLVRRITTEGAAIAALARTCIACIGPSTARTAREHHLPVAVTPDEHTLMGLVAALEQFFATGTTGKREEVER